MLTLVIGGARSGKSRFAQSICSKGPRVTYFATARPEDNEMRARIARHRTDRPAEWLTIEEPLRIANTVALHASNADFILLDCLTLWLSNFSAEHRCWSVEELELAILKEVARLIAASASSHLVIVTSEIGSGIVPESPVGRLFRDLQGLVNQQVAKESDFACQMVAGIPLRIKPLGGCA